VAEAAALAVYAVLLAAASVVVWRRPVAALFLWIVGLAAHNAVMAALYAAGVRGGVLTFIQAWKEILLAVAWGRVLLDAMRKRALPFRPQLVDWLALAFVAFVVVYAFVPQSALGGFASHKTVAYAFRHDVVPVAVFLLFRSLGLARAELRRVAWTLLAVAAAVATVGLVDVYAVSIGWWRTNGVVDYFRKQLGYDYHGTGGLPENFVFNVGGDKPFLRRLVSTFLSPLGAAYMFVVALLVGWRLLTRRVAIALGVVVAAGLLFTFTRAALFALAGGLLVLALLRRSAVAVGAATVTVGIAIAWVHVFPKIGPTGNWTRADLVYQHERAKQRGGTAAGALSTNEDSLRSHWRNLKDGVRTVAHHPQGYGLGNAGQAANRFEHQVKAGESEYTELGVEVGVAGALVWIAWSLAVLWGLVRAGAAAVAAAFAAVLALAVQTDVLGDPWLAYCLWALAGALCVQREAATVPEASRERADLVTTPA
jgi:hypothetical protein